MFDKLGSGDLPKSVGNEEVVKKMEKWQIRLKKVGLVINSADEKQFFKPLVKMWERELRNFVTWVMFHSVRLRYLVKVLMRSSLPSSVEEFLSERGGPGGGSDCGKIQF